jgi:biopolymer transport protein ExbD
MARRSRIQMDDEDTELNMTPMLDVVFILLIFFRENTWH